MNLLKATDRPLNTGQQRDLTWLISHSFTMKGRLLKKSDGEFYAEEISKLFPHEDQVGKKSHIITLRKNEKDFFESLLKINFLVVIFDEQFC